MVGDDVDVVSSWDNIKASKITLADFERYQVALAVHPFFNGEKDYFASLQRLTTFLQDTRTHWSSPWYLLVRESANWVYARLQVVRDSNLAKADFVKMLREARHSGLAVGVDTLKWTSMDKDVRDIADYTFIKRVGAIGLPDDLNFLYSIVAPWSLRRLRPDKFVLLTAQGSVAFGKFEYPSFHKEEREDIVSELGIKVIK